MLALVAALILTGGQSGFEAPSRAIVGRKTLDAHRALLFEVAGLRLAVDGKQKWRVDSYYPASRVWQVSPNGSAAASWGNSAVDLYALADGSSTACDLEAALTEGERPATLVGSRGAWVSDTAVEATLRTRKLWDERTRDVRVRCERGIVRRLTLTADVPFGGLIELMRIAPDAPERRQLMVRLAWSAQLRSNWSQLHVVGALARLARDDALLRTQALLALQDQGSPGWAALLDFAGKDAQNDEAVLWALRSTTKWDADAQRRALLAVLWSKVDPLPLKLKWFDEIGRQFGDLGEVAILAAQSPHPELRQALLDRLADASISPSHLRAALRLLDLDGAREVVLTQLADARPRTVTSDIVAALERSTVQQWPEGCLRLGEHLQASGESRLAGGVFAAGLVAAEESGDALYTELLSHLALNLITRGERAEGHRVITQLEGSTGSSVCALGTNDVTVDVMPKCPGRLSPGAQAAALRRIIP